MQWHLGGVPLRDGKYHDADNASIEAEANHYVVKLLHLQSIRLTLPEATERRLISHHSRYDRDCRRTPRLLPVVDRHDPSRIVSSYTALQRSILPKQVKALQVKRWWNRKVSARATAPDWIPRWRVEHRESRRGATGI